jgi:hypothetical protein
MDLNNYLTGDSQPDLLKGFEWSGNKAAIKPKNELPEPFPSGCAGRAGHKANDAECAICPNRHRDLCLAFENTRQSGLGRSLVDKKKAFTKLEREIMSALTLKALNGTPWIELKTFLHSRYAKNDLMQIKSLLAKWLKNPGVLGHIVVDSDFFDDCRTAQDKIQHCKFRPIMVLQKEKCIDCSHKLMDQCARLGCQLLSESSSISPIKIINRINELRMSGLISDECDLKCRFLVKKAPLKALKTAVYAIGNSSVLFTDKDLSKSIELLGDMSHDDTFTFQNEPDDVKEVKSYLGGSQMVVQIDPPPEFEKNPEDSTYYSAGAGIDGYLSY